MPPKLGPFFVRTLAFISIVISMRASHFNTLSGFAIISSGLIGTRGPGLIALRGITAAAVITSVALSWRETTTPRLHLALGKWSHGAKLYGKNQNGNRSFLNGNVGPWFPRTLSRNGLFPVCVKKRDLSIFCFSHSSNHIYAGHFFVCMKLFRGCGGR